MVDATFSAEALQAPANGADSRNLLEWLESGRLTLLDETRQAVTLDRWSELSAIERSNALADFTRVVRGRAKAAVLYLRD